MIIPEGYDTYKKYIGIKLHFNDPKFDYFNANVRHTVESFNKRKDFYQFKNLEKALDPKSADLFFAANFLKKPKLWVGDLLQEEAKKTFLERKGAIESLTYRFKQDLETLKNMEDSEEYDRPLLARSVMQNRITLETFIILMDMYNLREKVDLKLANDVIYQSFWFRCQKYRPFFTYDISFLQEIVRSQTKHET